MRQPNRRLMALSFWAVGLLFAARISTSPGASAGSVSPTITGMFPKQVGEFAYADLKSARQYPWFPQLREQLMPDRFREFEGFLTSAGVDPNSQVDELAWGIIAPSESGGEEVVGVALGAFNPSSSEDRFKQQKLPMLDVHGYHLYAFGGGTGASDILFMFIDSNTAAFGHRAALEELIDVRMGVTDSLLMNDQLFPLINEANGSGVIWAVLDQHYTNVAVEQLLPQANQFPQAAKIISRLRAMIISVEADSGVDAHFQAVCDSPDDANLLAVALQASLLYRRHLEAKTHPELAGALDEVNVAPSGDRLVVEAPLSQDQLLSLIQTHAFAMPM
jgi:hypothetical protein